MTFRSRTVSGVRPDPPVLSRARVAYQPVVDLRTGQVVALEALARFEDELTGAWLPPAAFLPELERTGEVVALDRLVAQRSVAHLARWRAAHPGRPLSVGVNLSVRDLDDPSLPVWVAALCEAYAVPPDALVLEVTETLPSEEGRGHERVLDALVALGCNVTLDDFGTGYSSLSYLQRFPVRGIKVDRSFTARLGTDGRGDRVVRGLVELALTLGVHVVAEGVETPAQLRALQELGCPFGQGYLFSPAVPAVDVPPLLDQAYPVQLQVAV